MPRRIDDSRLREIRSREAEYQAVWQACYRTTRKDAYIQAGLGVRRMMLREALTSLMERRREQGKRLCGINIELTIERHLGREFAGLIRPPSPPFRQAAAMLAPPMVASNAIHGIANPPHDIIFGPPDIVHPEAPPQGPIPFQGPDKPDIDPYQRNPQPVAPYPPSPPVAGPNMPGDEGQAQAFYDDSSAYFDERSQMIQRINDLERQVAELGQAFSQIFLQLNPDLATASMPTGPTTGDENLVNMSQAADL